MNASVICAVSRSFLPPSAFRQRCFVSNSSSCVCSSSVRLPTQHLYTGEIKNGKQLSADAVNMRRAAPEGDQSAFQDEERCAEEGIRCYSNEDGEVTCEGFDEGPHFHPVARAQQRTVMKNAKCVSLLTKGNTGSPSASPTSELSRLGVVQVEARGESYCEGKDEC